jgi:hypothetical protein
MEVQGTLEGRQDYAIHGQRYARLFFSLPDNSDAVQQCQLPDDAFDADLKAGDQIVITFVLKTVMEIRKASA